MLYVLSGDKSRILFFMEKLWTDLRSNKAKSVGK